MGAKDKPGVLYGESGEAEYLSLETINGYMIEISVFEEYRENFDRGDALPLIHLNYLNRLRKIPGEIRNVLSKGPKLDDEVLDKLIEKCGEAVKID